MLKKIVKKEVYSMKNLFASSSTDVYKKYAHGNFSSKSERELGNKKLNLMQLFSIERERERKMDGTCLCE